MIRAVLDSNVLISSLFWKGLPRHIVDLAIAQHIENITSPDILSEIESVLYEDFSDIPYSKIEEIIRDILSYSHLVISEKIVVKGLRDIADAKIIACAIAGKADYIVTGDKDLLVLREYKGIRIVTPKTFSEILK
ncbi:MAG: putative toxin-antitoxin system toxin component, PIN family [Candidatus Omnitrophota bacterium]